jgi:hypothetical protein
MRSARVTVLMKPEEKAALEAKAAKRGVSSGEYLRLAVDNFGKVSDTEEAALSALAAEIRTAVPRMRASLERMSSHAQELHEELDAFLRQKGIRA